MSAALTAQPGLHRAITAVSVKAKVKGRNKKRKKSAMAGGACATIMDQELRFAVHAAYAIGKGTKYVLACKRLTKPSKGAHVQMMKKLYEGVAVPKMMYAAGIWATTHLKPGRGKRLGGWGARGLSKKMEMVQRTAALAITGGMISIPTDTLFAHANLFPIPLLIRQHCQCATLHLATLPQRHPLHRHIKNALCNHCHHKSPLHHLLEAFPLDPQVFETIDPVHHSTKWTPLVRIKIPEKDKAIMKDIEDEAHQDIVIYSDGSGHNRKIGSTAILCCKGIQTASLCFHLGTDTDHTVYKEEIIGMILTTELLQRTPRIHKASLTLDNKAAILATQVFTSKPGHYLMDIFHMNLKAALKRHCIGKVLIRWIPGHTEIPGNEAADTEAKAATTGNLSDPTLLSRFLWTRRNHSRMLP